LYFYSFPFVRFLGACEDLNSAIIIIL